MDSKGEENQNKGQTAVSEVEKPTKINKLILDGFKSFGKRTELLFDNQFNVVLGPNGSGKCLTGESQVLLADGSLVRIDQLVNKNSANAAPMDDGWVAPADGTRILALGKDLKIRQRIVKAFVKRTAPEKLIRIRTRSGRTVTATPYHPLFILDNETVRAVRADELKTGIRIAVPRELPVKKPDKVFAELLNSISAKDGIYVPWSREIEDIIKRNKSVRKWKDIADSANIPVMAIKGFCDKQAINFAFLVRLLRFFGITDDEIMQLIPEIKSKTSSRICKMPWKNSPELARLLGYLLAEGRMPESSSQIWFTNGTEEIVQDYHKLINLVFGINATINEYKPNVWDVLAYSEPVRLILQKLGMPVGKTEEKTITNLFLNNSGNQEIAGLLSGLYSGDGYVSPTSIELTTKSPSLAFAVETLLLRLGITSRKKPVIKIATNTGFSGRYCQIITQGINNFIKFAENIFLMHPAKAKRITNLLGKKPNSNLDLINANNLVRKAVKEQKLSVKKLKKAFPRLDAYVYDQCLPSRTGVQHLVQNLFSDSSTVQMLRTLCTSDILWDEIIDFEVIAPENPWVYDLCVEEDHNFIANNIFVHNSNILDALCFVLGKRSSKELRAERASNLIYNGGKTKNPAKNAEVSIVFDNSSKIFPIAEDTIKLSRIVTQSGQSKYKINSRTRTRQEVLELLSSAKINPDGYNIILQGDITRLVEMSPVERRQIIEEIAGISVYEEKKQQALKELEKVEAKLGEASVILRERERTLTDLKKDRDQALKYKELSDKIKTNKASYCKRQIGKKVEEKQKFDEKIGKHRAKLANLQSQISKLREEIGLRRKQISEINEQIKSKSQGEQLELQKNLEKLRVQTETDRQRISSCQADINKLSQRKQQLKSESGELALKLEDLKKQEKELSEAEKDLKSQIAGLDKTIADFKKKHQIGEDSEIEKNIEGLEKQAEEKQKQIQKLREEQQELLRQKDKVEVYLQTIDSKIEQVLELEKAHKTELSQLKSKKQELKKAILELNELLNRDSENAGKLGTAKQLLYSAEQGHIKLSHRHAEFQQKLGENIAVKKITENKAKLGEIHGTVSELGTADSKYSLALDVAAAQKAQSIVVENDETAAKCIAYLKKNKLGIATFLPLNKIKPSKQNKQVSELAKKPGVLGLAVGLVDFDEKFRDVFSYVFGSTLVVDSIETARKLGVGKARMVTLDGDLCEFSGAMSGGFRHRKSGSFRAKELKSNLEKSEKLIEKHRKDIENLEKSRKADEDKIANLRELRATLEGGILKTEKSLHIDSGDLDANREYKEKLLNDRNEIDSNLKEFDDQLAERTQELTKLKIQLQEWRNKRAEIRNVRVLAELAAYEQKRKELYEQQVGVSAELKSLAERFELFGKDTSDTGRLLKDLDAEKSAFEQEIKDLKAKISKQEKEIREKEKEQEQFTTQFSGLFDRQKKLNDEISERDSRVLEIEEQARKQELSVNTLGIEETKLKTELNILNSEFEAYEGIEIDTEKPEEQLKKEIAEFEKMVETIGAVNMRALDVYETAEKEYKILVDKKQVLVSEKDAVLNLMAEIEGNKKALFGKVLQVVDTNFKNFFSRLTTKGDAYLQLENPEQPFDGGLSIKVRLTGNKFLDIRSLSGGEKTLTALAFLFAIQEHEPASFYVLDEVDAALDKENSERLAKLVRTYCKKAQYIVISHNDAVISEGNTLYGVSMDPEKGLSNVVSLRA